MANGLDAGVKTDRHLPARISSPIRRTTEWRLASIHRRRAGATCRRHRIRCCRSSLLRSHGCHHYLRPVARSFSVVDKDGAVANQEGESSLHEDSGRFGKAAEHLVASSCILASDLQLNVSTSFVDDEGVDLVFHRRGGTATLGVQVKARSTATSVVQRAQFIANVRQVTFRPRRTLWMLFVVVDKPTATIPLAWFVPSEDFDQLASRNLAGGATRRITASTKPGSNDQWRPYRLDFPQLPGRILSVLDELEQSP